MATYTPNTASPTAAVIYQRDLTDQITSRTAYTTTAGGVTQLLASNEQSFAPGATDWTGGTVTAGTYVGANNSGAQLVNTSPATAGHVYTARVQLVSSTFDFNELSLQFYNSANLLLDARYAIMTDQAAGTYTVTYTAPANTTRVAMQINGNNYESNPATITIANASLIRHNPATTTVETHRYSQGATLDTNGTVIERTIALPGGATITKRASGDVWSHPNIHGDIQATADSTGVKQGPTHTYDPYGNPLTTTPDNLTGGIDNTWLGQHNRWNDKNPGSRPLIQMGARPYDPVLGRFFEVDPVEGGSCNDYDYTCAEPINMLDLDGRKPCATQKTVTGTVVTKFGRRQSASFFDRGMVLYSLRFPSLFKATGYFTTVTYKCVAKSEPNPLWTVSELANRNSPGFWSEKGIGKVTSGIAACASGGSLGSFFAGGAAAATGLGAFVTAFSVVGALSGCIGGVAVDQKTGPLDSPLP